MKKYQIDLLKEIIKEEDKCSCQYETLKRYWGSGRGIVHNRNCATYSPVDKSLLTPLLDQNIIQIDKLNKIIMTRKISIPEKEYAKGKRDRKRLKAIKGHLKPINKILNQIK